MPELDIPLFSGVYRNIDETVTKDLSYKLIDGILDEAPSISSRPGLALLKASASGRRFDGLFWVDTLSLLFGLSNGTLYKYDGAFTETSLAGVTINAGIRASFVFDGTYLLVANGGKIMYTNGTAVTQFIADAQCPVTVRRILLLDTYLLAFDFTTDTWNFSEPGDSLTWAALDFASAESKPDANGGGIVFRDEFYIFGRESMEIWEDDGVTPFARVAGGAFPTGCIAPDSVLALDNEIIWLSSDNRFVKFAGSGIEKLSTPYDLEIEKFNTVADCTADRYDIKGKTFAVFQFPGQGRTLVYNSTNNNWSEWGYWNLPGGFHEAFIGGCHVFIPEIGLHVVGSRKEDGKLYEMSEEFFTDDGNVINIIAVSGHINFGTNKYKRNNSMSINVKRGYVEDDSVPVATLRFKDDKGPWSNEIELDLGAMGDYEAPIIIHRTGRYITRQFEFKCSAPVGFVFSEAKEDFIVTR